MSKMNWDRAREQASRAKYLVPPVIKSMSDARTLNVYSSLAGMPLLWKVQEGDGDAYTEAIRRWENGSRSRSVKACRDLLIERGVIDGFVDGRDQKLKPMSTERTPEIGKISSAEREQLGLASEDASFAERLDRIQHVSKLLEEQQKVIAATLASALSR